MARTYVSMIFDNNQFGNIWRNGDTLVKVEGEEVIWPNMPDDIRHPNCSCFIVRDDGHGIWANLSDEDFERIQEERSCGYFFLSHWVMDEISILSASLSDDDIRAIWKARSEDMPAWMNRFYEWLPSV